MIRGGRAALVVLLLGVGGAAAQAAGGGAAVQATGGAQAAGGAAAQAGAPADAAVESLLQRLRAAQADVRTLAADFTQRNRVKLFRQELTSQGRLIYDKGDKGDPPARPARLRWEYTAPDPSLLLLIGERAELRAPGQAPRTFDTGRDGTLRAVFDQMGLWLGSGAVQTARRDNTLSVAGTAAAPTLVLIPREGTALARVFARVELRLDGKTLLLRGLLLQERSGDEKEITLSRVQRNPVVPAGTF